MLVHPIIPVTWEAEDLMFEVGLNNLGYLKKEGAKGYSSMFMCPWVQFTLFKNKCKERF